MFVLLLLLWIVLNGHISMEIIILGILIAGLVYGLAWKFWGYTPKKELLAFRLAGPALMYLCVLIWEILKANLAVIRIVLAVKYENEPVIVTFRTKLNSNLARVVLANSITLTPGTITVELEDNKYTVHCLDRELADGIESSVFVKRLLEMERIAGVRPAKEKKQKSKAKEA